MKWRPWGGEVLRYEAEKTEKSHSKTKVGKTDRQWPWSMCTGLCPVNIDDNKYTDVIKFIHYTDNGCVVVLSVWPSDYNDLGHYTPT